MVQDLHHCPTVIFVSSKVCQILEHRRWVTWTSRQADPARALVLFEDHLTAPALTVSGVATSLLLSDGSAILEVLMLAQRLGVLLTP
jgi:hypothetical protein